MRKGRLITDLKMKEVFDKTGYDETDKKAPLLHIRRIVFPYR